ncbi:hypothetical protein Pint_06786 [Pistacia integerrima]|uniref:Uncharacterized protein n=1 Tax=Pistacia integerrima TaxID=434235 RepID=A0ACC0XZZ8_9ROSI|nr:hypothetical protein Pint_06786 [Pistacia integerrima]
MFFLRSCYGFHRTELLLRLPGYSIIAWASVGRLLILFNIKNQLVFCTAVKLNANQMVVGTLRWFDQFMNLVVDNTVEVNGNEKTDIGMVVSLCLFLLLADNQLLIE